MSAICASKQFRATAEMTQDAKYSPRADAFRFAPELGHCSTHPPLRLCADTVAKVENRSAPKISRKLIFGRLCRCVAFQRH
jgi:hypothetical protein